jgi:hypothetical protein
MVYKIWEVRYPQMIIDILGNALRQGSVDLIDIQQILVSVRNKSKAGGYLNLCLQSRLLYPADYTTYIQQYLPTARGRCLYRQAKQNNTASIHSLLGSLPYYHFHVELLLAEILLTYSLKYPHLVEIIRETIDRVVPWYLEERLPWILDQVGWKDSHTYTNTQYWQIKSKIYYIEIMDHLVERRTFQYWDEYLRFSKPSYLTCVNNICGFLAERRNEYLILDWEWLSQRSLAVLVILILAQLEGMSLKTTGWSDAIEDLIRLGINIQHRNHHAFLRSPIKLILPYPLDKLEGLTSTTIDDQLTGVFRFLTEIEREKAVDDLSIQVSTIQLSNLLVDIKDLLGQPSRFVPTELSDNQLGLPDSLIEIWQNTSFLHLINTNFHEQVCELCQPSYRTKPGSVILLTSNQLDLTNKKLLGDLLTTNPHLYLLLMLLIDQPQSHLSPILQDNIWHYNGKGLLMVLDSLLRCFGYDIWDEWYVEDIKQRSELAQKLVDLLSAYQVAQIQYNRLELTENFIVHLQSDLAYLANQTHFVRQRIRQTLLKSIDITQ